MTGAGIFLIRNDGELVEMTEEAYDSEGRLQTLLVRHPNLLAGGQINSAEPRRWLLVRREAPIPVEDGGSGWFSVDHLFLDQDGVPTLVEVKRSSDTRIRREVIGQMLDYAANAVLHWPVETIRSLFEDRCESEGEDPDAALNELLEGEPSSEEFWGQVKTNLLAGRLRLVFVADVVPPELQRVVEFLNQQMDPAEVLAIEIRQYVGDSALLRGASGMRPHFSPPFERTTETLQWRRLALSCVGRRNANSKSYGGRASSMGPSCLSSTTRAQDTGSWLYGVTGTSSSSSST